MKYFALAALLAVASASDMKKDSAEHRAAYEKMFKEMWGKYNKDGKMDLDTYREMEKEIWNKHKQDWKNPKAYFKEIT